MTLDAAAAPDCPDLSIRLVDGVLTLESKGRQLAPMAVQFLQAALQGAMDDQKVRVVLLCGPKSAALCGVLGGGTCSDLVRLLRSLPQPVVAKLPGGCNGSALALITACDIVYVADDAQFALDAADHEHLLDGTLAEAISRVMTPRSVSRLALTAGQFNGVEAASNGLATLSFPASMLDAATDALLTTLLQKEPLALQFTKQTLRHVPGMSWDAVLDYNKAKFAEFNSLLAGGSSSRAAAVERFLAGASKPGLGS